VLLHKAQNEARLRCLLADGQRFPNVTPVWKAILSPYPSLVPRKGSSVAIRLRAPAMHSRAQLAPLAPALALQGPIEDGRSRRSRFHGALRKSASNH
jgi:hypothetical protein